MFTGIIIRTDGLMEKISFHDFSTYMNRELGGNFECVTIPEISMTLWLNDCGKLDGLFPNAIASLLFSQYIGDDILVGNVVCLGDIDDNTGDVLSLSSSQIDFFYNHENLNF